MDLRPHQLVQHGLGICSILCAHGGQLGRLSIGCAVWIILLLSRLLQQRATLDIGVSQRKVQARLLEEAGLCTEVGADSTESKARTTYTCLCM